MPTLFVVIQTSNQQNTPSEDPDAINIVNFVTNAITATSRNISCMKDRLKITPIRQWVSEDSSDVVELVICTHYLYYEGFRIKKDPDVLFRINVSEEMILTPDSITQVIDIDGALKVQVVANITAMVSAKVLEMLLPTPTCFHPDT